MSSTAAWVGQASHGPWQDEPMGCCGKWTWWRPRQGAKQDGVLTATWNLRWCLLVEAAGEYCPFHRRAVLEGTSGKRWLESQGCTGSLWGSVTAMEKNSQMAAEGCSCRRRPGVHPAVCAHLSLSVTQRFRRHKKEEWEMQMGTAAPALCGCSRLCYCPLSSQPLR
jgi:hypothetical protein